MLYDFEAFQDKTQRKEVTATLTFENMHIPISVSVGETLEQGPTHLCDANPKELLRKFMEEVEYAGKHSDQSTSGLHTRRCEPASKKAAPQNREFNSGHYDVNLIKKHFAEQLAGTAPKVRVAKMGIMPCSCSLQASALSTLSYIYIHYQLPWPGNQLREVESLRMHN